MAGKTDSFGFENYRRGGLERIGDASLLLRAGQFAGAIYMAGRGVESLLRAAIWRPDPEIQRDAVAEPRRVRKATPVQDIQGGGCRRLFRRLLGDRQAVRGDMRKEELEQTLVTTLKLCSPRFKLQKIGSKLSGHVISDTFRGKADSARQQMIWDALESAFGPEAAQHVGTLLAYTNDEWNIDLPAKAG